MAKRIKEIIDELNQTDEHYRLEAKHGNKIGKSILETVCSFSNEPGLEGGTIVLGVSEDRDSLFPSYVVTGVDDPDKLQKDLASQCAEVFNVPVRPRIVVENHENKNVIIIDVEEAAQPTKPIYFQKQGLPGGAFRRIGSTDQRCTTEDLYLFYNKEDEFDSAVIKDSDLDDLSESAVERYRKLRKEVNAAAEELEYEDKDMLRALNAVKKVKGEWKLTNTGLLVFGKKMALRRLMPMVRVDYIRVPGRTWIDDPEKRFINSLDLRGPLIELVSRAIGVIVDDLPSDFLLPEGELQAKSKWKLPYRVLREAIVNAFIHRSYRLNQPIQIIRYSNRLEIRNAGFSLKPLEQVSEPGSFIRNASIAAIFHDTNLAETKGTGFRTMEKLMKAAEMVPPTYESDHHKNSFVLRLLLHHFLNENDLKWLGHFHSYDLTDTQKMGLVFIREVGAIDNLSYRQLTGLTSHQASLELRKLTITKMFTQKGGGKNTYYIPSDLLNTFLSAEAQELLPQLDSLSTPAEGLLPQTDGLLPQTGSLLPQVEKKDLPSEIQQKIDKIGQRSQDAELITDIIKELCAYRPFSISELAALLGRGERYIRKRYINNLMEKGILEYTIPKMISHPKQKYRTKEQDAKR